MYMHVHDVYQHVHMLESLPVGAPRSLHVNRCGLLLPVGTANPQKLTLKILRIDYRTQHLLDNDYHTHNVRLRTTKLILIFAFFGALMRS